MKSQICLLNSFFGSLTSFSLLMHWFAKLNSQSEWFIWPTAFGRQPTDSTCRIGGGRCRHGRKDTTVQYTPIWVGRHNAQRPDIYRRRKSARCVVNGDNWDLSQVSRASSCSSVCQLPTPSSLFSPTGEQEAINANEPSQSPSSNKKLLKGWEMFNQTHYNYFWLGGGGPAAALRPFINHCFSTSPHQPLHTAECTLCEC